MGATAVLQTAIVVASGSLALLSDTIHNVGHLLTTIPLLVAFRLGRRPPSARYPFGYRRAEDLMGVLIALVVAASAAWIVWEAVQGIVDPRTPLHLGWVFAAGVVGAVGNEIVAVYRIRVGRRIGSAALVAEGNHARADGLTSVAVVLGVLGVWLGLPEADAVVGLLIATAILIILGGTVRSIVRRLMDGVDDGTVDRLADAASAVPGVTDVDEVRARWTGHRLEAQLVLGIEAGRSLPDADAITQRVIEELQHTVPHLGTVVARPRPHDELARPKTRVDEATSSPSVQPEEPRP